MSKSTYQHCLDHTLILPDSLKEMADIQCLYDRAGNAIFYKDLDQELPDIEFYSNSFCIVYLVSGEETITAFDDSQIILKAGEMMFVPQDQLLLSDYLDKGAGLKAYLFFFNAKTVSQFLEGSSRTVSKAQQAHFHRIRSSQAISDFIDALAPLARNVKSAPEIMSLKLLELLHLIDVEDDQAQLRAALSLADHMKSRRNIKRLMERFCLSNLSVSDYAQLAGRSIASFNRDFRRIYGTSPKKWLLSRRMIHARNLLDETDNSVTRVAMESGYDSISHFIKVFKNHHGLTPNQIRKASAG